MKDPKSRKSRGILIPDDPLKWFVNFFYALLLRYVLKIIWERLDFSRVLGLFSYLDYRFSTFHSGIVDEESEYNDKSVRQREWEAMNNTFAGIAVFEFRPEMYVYDSDERKRIVVYPCIKTYCGRPRLDN